MENVQTSPSNDGVPLDQVRQQRHELLNALAAILGFTADLVRRFEKEGRGEVVADLQRVERSARRMRTMIGGAGVPNPSETFATAVATELNDPAPASCGTALLVDDEVPNREMLATLLRRRAFRVAEAGAAAEAERILARDAIDVVLLDVGMPGVSGLELLQNIRLARSANDLPVIMLTGNDDTKTVVEALRHGANDYVTKSTSVDVLVARVQTQISVKRASDTVRNLNTELRAAQAKIARMVDSSGDALADLPKWAASMAVDLARVIHAESIAVWASEATELVAVIPTDEPPPHRADLDEARRSGRFLSTADRTVIAVAGITGRLAGGLVVAGKRSAWSDSERQMIATFAFQLAGAIEMKQVRAQLDIAREKQQEAMRILTREGIRKVRVCSACRRCYDEGVLLCTVDGAPMTERPFPLTLHERYRLRRRLGKGGMGEVYQALDLQLHREVAVKVINPEHSSALLRRQLQREARSLARVDSPLVIRIFDSGEIPGGSAFIVTEMLYGADLKMILDEFGPGNPRQVASLLRQASAALTTAHNAGLIHRDVKPANIFMLNGDNASFAVKMIDFGIAKNTADAESTMSLFIGTPPYMSPEQLGAQPLTVATDVYSLAAVAWEALTGSRLVPSDDIKDIFVEVIMRQPRPISNVFSDATCDVDELFVTALAREAEDRPDLRVWANALAVCLEELPGRYSGWPDVLPRLAAVEGDVTLQDPILRPDIAADASTVVETPVTVRRRGPETAV